MLHGATRQWLTSTESATFHPLPYQYWRFHVKRKKRRIHTSLPAIKDHGDCDQDYAMSTRGWDRSRLRDCTCESTRTLHWRESMRAMLRQFYGHTSHVLPPTPAREKKATPLVCVVQSYLHAQSILSKARMSPRSQEYTSTTMFSIWSLKTSFPF